MPTVHILPSLLLGDGEIIYTQESANDVSSDKAEAEGGQDGGGAPEAGPTASLGLPSQSNLPPGIPEDSKDSYLYQCPFCFWSSNLINLSGTDGGELMSCVFLIFFFIYFFFYKLTKRLELPWDNGKKTVETIRDQVKKYNDTLRDEIDERQKIEKKLISLGGLRSNALTGRLSFASFSFFSMFFFFFSQQKKHKKLYWGNINTYTEFYKQTNKTKQIKKRKKFQANEVGKTLKKEMAEKKKKNSLHGITVRAPEAEETEMKELIATDRF
ncbi:hypothetical protein RFI_17064, partial [Reticulomyxa filosa]